MSSHSEATKFARAVRGGDVKAVRAMAAAEPGIVRATDPESFGAPPLVRAVETDDRAMVDLLLELGADINQRSDWWAGSFGVLDSGEDAMAEHLLRRGATLTPHAAARLGKIGELRAMLDQDASVVDARGGDGQTPLHFARTAEVAELLLSRGAKIDALDIDHASTPAQWLGSSRIGTTAYLVKRGAAADPFMAARIGDVGLLEKLVRAEPEGVKVRVSRQRFPAAPPAAGHIYIYTIGEECGLVQAAVGANQAESVRWLVANGAEVNERGGYDNATALHVAAWNDQAEAAAALIDAGAEINAKSGPMHSNEPIGWAIVGGSPKAFRVLLERGAKMRDQHREDARKGAEGAFREYSPRKALSNWQEIEKMLATDQHGSHG